MSINKLNITEVSQKCPSFPEKHPRENRRLQIQAQMERDWLQHPEEFNPERDCIQRQRVVRTIQSIQGCIDLNKKRGVDLGCAAGVITRKLRDLGIASLDAVDVATQALKELQLHDMSKIKAIQDCLPNTRLNDSDYDLVVCTEVIGFLEAQEYRLLFAELSRIVKNDGIVICSTSLDPNSENALSVFSQLAESEFQPLRWSLSYHRSMVRLCRFFEGPASWLRHSRDAYSKQKSLEGKKGFGLYWNKFMLSSAMRPVWWLLSVPMTPIGKWLRQSDRIMDIMESISRFFLGPDGASHVTFVGKRRPLTFPLPANEIPIERKGKRQVWD
jgi:2-polyprenyl-3-methyl-5-hydroxy-6-metoxy-1,4-benzoquinol methylase